MDLPLNMSRKDFMDLKRALTDSDITSVLEDVDIRETVANLPNNRNAFRMNVPRKGPPSAGQSAAVVTRRSAGNTAAEFVADDATLTEDTGTYSQVTFTYRTVAIEMKVTTLAQLIGANYLDVFATEAELKAEDWANFEEKAIITETTSTSNAFDGLNELVPSGQVVKMTTTVTSDGTGGASLTEKKVRQAIDQAKGLSQVFRDDEGRPSGMILTSEGGGREFDALIASRQTLNDAKMDVAGGFRLSSYDGLPIFRTSTYGSSIFFSNSKPSNSELTGTTGSTTVAYFVNLEEFWVEELEPFRVVPLAKTDSQFDKAHMRATEAPVLRGSNSVSALVGIKV